MDTEIAWVAGLLEGEGSFLTKSGTSSPLIACQMTDLDVLEEVKRICGAGSIYVVAIRNEKWKQSWTFSVSGKEAARIMNMVRPYMKSRRTSAIDKALLTWNNRIAERNAVEQKAREAAEAWRNGEGSLRSLAERFDVGREHIRKYTDVGA